MKTDVLSAYCSVWDAAPYSPEAEATHKAMTIAEFIALCAEKKDCVANLRQLRNTDPEAYKKGKKTLPTALISGVNPRHNNTDFDRYNNVICIDIDNPKDNEATDWKKVKNTISKLPFVGWCSLSASGCGLWILVPISDHNLQREAYEQISADILRATGMQTDKSCSNIGRLRFGSYDPEAYYNPNAEIYTPISTLRFERPKITHINRGGTDWEKARTIAMEAVQKHIDITDDYNTWVRLGFALNAGLGDAGFEIFDAISSCNPRYNPRQTEIKYRQTSSPSSITLGTFFAIAKEFGLCLPRTKHTRGNYDPHAIGPYLHDPLADCTPPAPSQVQPTEQTGDDTPQLSEEDKQYLREHYEQIEYDLALYCAAVSAMGPAAERLQICYTPQTVPMNHAQLEYTRHILKRHGFSF